MDAYRDIIQSVAIIGIGGNTFCTGFLVNNARQDCTPYFMTAFHCGINAGNAASFVAYWNYQNSTCRQPGSPASGGPGNGVLSDFNTGAFFRAGWGPSDFTLLELDDPVSATANAFFAGWSAENFPPSDTVICVHHPSTDEKRISFEFDPTYIGTWAGGSNPVPNGNHIIVPDWDIGTTEGGSSGAPLFNNQKRVVGQLHGGLALCSNNEYDSYGWFHSSWEGGGTPASRLRNWLDPDGTGILVLDGRSQLQCSFFVAGTPASISLCAPADAVYTVTVSDNFEADVTLTISGLPIGATAAFLNNPLPPGGSTVLTISNTAAIADGIYIFQLEGTDGTETSISELSLNILTAVPDAVQLLAPANGESGTNLTPLLTWQAQPATFYTIEIAADENFDQIVESAANLTSGSYPVGAVLNILTNYYWRVRGSNLCGEGTWSDTYLFKTGAILCTSKASSDVPKPISQFGTPVVTSTLPVSAIGNLADVNVTNLAINHTWVGDLRIELTSPGGTTITLMTNPGGGDCPNDNLLVFFDDQSSNSYAMLDAMCESGPLAISGSFQPFQPLATFNGEPAAGTWILTVYDDENFDGGALTGWGLEVCSVIPNDFSLSPSANDLSSCIGGEITFTVLTGTAYEDEITLTANNLPPGATALFEPNPATPGSQVSVTVSGATEAGSFDFEITGSDGTNEGSTSLNWTVIGPPDAPAPVSPAQNAMNVGLSASFTWSAIPGATYLLQVATDPDMSNLFFTGSPSGTSANVTGMAYCTEYYWTVTAVTTCGTSIPSEVYAFSTVPDLAFNTNPAVVTSCIASSGSTSLTLGTCFEAGGVELTAVAPMGGFTVGFSANPAMPGSTVEIVVQVGNIMPGSYPIEIQGTDGTSSVTTLITLQVQGPPAAPVMTQPANGATMVGYKNPLFQWQAVPGATDYNFELATDDNFTNIVHAVQLSGTSYTLPSDLSPLTIYFWRVTSFNNCGGSTPSAFSFTTDMEVAVFEMQGLQVEILPNPTGGPVFLKFSTPVPEQMDLVVFAANGILVRQQRIAIGETWARLDLSAFPAGVYWVKLTGSRAVLTEKIILQP